ncbi:hypothetical protein EC991_001486 [Linnemannia zychae]|nr:hypothetical protein EC991_001486 [Linnemannia zychae]
MAAIDRLFDILELTTHIADYLSQHTLTACCLVSHSWHSTFTPHLWHSITIRLDDPLPKFTTPAGRNGLLRNGNHIRVLRSPNLESLKPFLEYGTTCTNLICIDAQWSVRETWSSKFYFASTSSMDVRRSAAMMATGRRGSVGTGQKQKQRHPFGFGNSGILFGSPAVTASIPVMITLPVDSTTSSTSPSPTAATTTLVESILTSSEHLPPAPAASEPAAISNGSAPSPALFDAPALPATSSFGSATTAPSLFGAASASAGLFGSASASTGFVSAPIATTPSSLGSTPAQTFGAPSLSLGGMSRAPLHEWDETLETILITIIRRNPRIEFLAVPSHCLQSEALCKVVAENLPELKEFYSPSDQECRDGSSTTFTLAKECGGVGFEHSTPVFTGSIYSPMSYPILEIYPRLMEIQLRFIARINRDTLKQIRSFDKDSFSLVRFEKWALSHVSLILEELPAETGIVFDLESSMMGKHVGSENIPVIFKCAPRLEHMSLRGCDIDEDIIQAIICTSPRLKIFQTMAENHGYRPFDEARLNALSAFASPWASRQFEIFECKIVNVPRPDVTTVDLDLDGHLILPNLIPQAPTPPQVPILEELQLAQQQSQIFQRRILQQLGQLTHLRALRLGRYGRDHNDPFYVQLDIRGVQPLMLVDSYFQTDCLELSLESGLDELAGLEQLEELDVSQMAHRIGMEEVRWMVEHWPNLKTVEGLKYEDCLYEILEGEEDEGGLSEETERVPEHVTWLLEQLQARQ